MELLPEMTLHRPSTVEEAINLHKKTIRGRYFAGGSDLIVNIRRGIEEPDTLVHLDGIPELHGITKIKEHEYFAVNIGASAVLNDVAETSILRDNYLAIAMAAGEVAGPTHREYATLGGNLCLDTRCIFYNQSEWWRAANNYCLKYRGDICHVAPGGNKCFATFSGDVAPALLLFDAEVELAGPHGRRSIPLINLYNNDGMDHLSLGKHELLVAVRLPKVSSTVSSGYAKSRVRGSIDFPLAGVAVRISVIKNKIAELRVGLTGVAPRPFLVEGLDKFIDNRPSGECLDALREIVRSQAKAMKTSFTPPHYRRRVAGVLAQKLAVSMFD